MSRSLKFTLLVGVQFSWILAALYAMDATLALDAALARALGLDVDRGTLRAHDLLEYLSIFALAFGMTWAAVDLPRPAVKVLLTAIAVAETFTLTGLLALYGAFLSPWLPALAAVLGYGAGLFYENTPVGRRQRLVQTIFHRRVSPVSARALTESRAPLAATGRGQGGELTVVVCEVVNHAELLEALSPADYLARINAFLIPAADTLVNAGGCLAACNAEGVRAIFGAPMPSGKDHAVAACRAALALARRVEILNGPRAAASGGNGHGGGGNGNGGGGAPGHGTVFDVRIGINSGEMVAGRFGARGRLDGYDATGEEAAFARRLCTANLIYGSTILLGARTHELAEGTIEVRPLELLRRGAENDWREIYELLGEPKDLTAEDLTRRDLFWMGVIFARERRFEDALEKFAEARALTPHADGPLDYHIERVSRAQQSQAAQDEDTMRLLDVL